MDEIEGPFIEAGKKIKVKYVMSVYDSNGQVEDLVIGEKAIKNYFNTGGKHIQPKRGPRSD